MQRKPIEFGIGRGRDPIAPPKLLAQLSEACGSEAQDVLQGRVPARYRARALGRHPRRVPLDHPGNGKSLVRFHAQIIGEEWLREERVERNETITSRVDCSDLQLDKVVVFGRGRLPHQGVSGQPLIDEHAELERRPVVRQERAGRPKSQVAESGLEQLTIQQTQQSQFIRLDLLSRDQPSFDLTQPASQVNTRTQQITDAVQKNVNKQNPRDNYRTTRKHSRPLDSSRGP